MFERGDFSLSVLGRFRERAYSTMLTPSPPALSKARGRLSIIDSAVRRFQG